MGWAALVKSLGIGRTGVESSRFLSFRLRAVRRSTLSVCEVIPMKDKRFSRYTTPFAISVVMLMSSGAIFEIQP